MQKMTISYWTWHHIFPQIRSTWFAQGSQCSPGRFMMTSLVDVNNTRGRNQESMVDVGNLHILEPIQVAFILRGMGLLLLPFLLFGKQRVCELENHQFESSQSEVLNYRGNHPDSSRDDFIIQILNYPYWLVVWNMFYFAIQLGISSSQLTFTPLFFQRGTATTSISQLFIAAKSSTFFHHKSELFRAFGRR